MICHDHEKKSYCKSINTVTVAKCLFKKPRRSGWNIGRMLGIMKNLNPFPHHSWLKRRRRRSIIPKISWNFLRGRSWFHYRRCTSNSCILVRTLHYRECIVSSPKKAKVHQITRKEFLNRFFNLRYVQSVPHTYGRFTIGNLMDEKERAPKMSFPRRKFQIYTIPVVASPLPRM